MPVRELSAHQHRNKWAKTGHPEESASRTLRMIDGEQEGLRKVEAFSVDLLS